ncbi:hypothetical protein MD535_06485 [Vibrio sp. ZSDZ65]|uniref:Uncharacterized protein n=1 Tax=Vibrio qingdaonensis TaxID=2829491 RepID=A0A9X3CLN1_9VIBR|nr:hypothetical protein [Vibrio qingdaonensis]MCW8345656.1 hypothetical protein [Vibrio qingdaonensis]
MNQKCYGIIDVGNGDDAIIYIGHYSHVPTINSTYYDQKIKTNRKIVIDTSIGWSNNLRELNALQVYNLIRDVNDILDLFTIENAVIVTSMLPSTITTSLVKATKTRLGEYTFVNPAAKWL